MHMTENIRGFLPELLEGLAKLWPAKMLDFDFGFSPVIAIAAYVLMGLGLFTIARNRKIQDAWLAWVPVVNIWLLGCISDQYRYVVRGQERNRRTLLLVLGIVQSAMKVVLFFLMICGLGGILKDLDSVADLLRGGGKLLGIAGLGLLLRGFGTVIQLFECLALYDLYSSCQPGKKTLYLLLSILGYLTGIDVLPALLVFLVRNKEEGMPPRISS